MKNTFKTLLVIIICLCLHNCARIGIGTSRTYHYRTVRTLSDGGGSYSSGRAKAYKIPRSMKKSLRASSSKTYVAQAGKLTAGSINDFGKWSLWQDIVKGNLEVFSKKWQIKPEDRYSAQVMTKDSFPLIGAKVSLLDKKEKIIWTSLTDNTGRAELWASMYLSKNNDIHQIKIQYEGKKWILDNPSRFENGINSIVLDVDCEEIRDLDIAFAVDATGSMGDEINYLKSDLINVLERVTNDLPELELNMASVFYRDKSDKYLTRKSDFTNSLSKNIKFIKQQSADGGGDFEEAVDEALDVAINKLNWSKSSHKLLFLVLDAPYHEDKNTLSKANQLISKASEKGIKIIPLAGSGINKDTEYLMRSIALATNGRYIALTNHSGIGGDHIEPTTDKLEVKQLNDLLVDYIKSVCYSTDCNTISEDSSLSNLIVQQMIQESNKKGEDLIAETLFQDDPILASADSTFLNKNSKKFNLSVFPNPSRGKIFISSTHPLEQAYLTDISGKLIFEPKAMNKGRTEFDLSDFSSGIYFFSSIYKGTVISRKIIISR
ncbi:MAG: T9SS type A sorting domain-containing protein [Flavobacteriales bacterium]|nr:T9SS type A sorting domain-containing protein [Flavobacteriales bacterium]